MAHKKHKIIYWVSTGLFTVLILFSAGNYIFNTKIFSEIFITLGYPIYIIYPLAIAKILGLLAIWIKKSRTLKEWAYAGFFFDFILAIGAHLNVNDGAFPFPLVALILLLTSYISEKKAYESIMK